MYNVGLIGCGRWGSNHLNVLANEVGTSISNLYVVDSKSIQHQGVQRCFAIEEFDDALALIDIAIIASPNQFHVSQAKQCLEQNIHVLVEKPLAQSIEELQPLLEVMTTTSAYLQVGYLLNSHPAIVSVAQYLEPQTIQRFEFSRSTTRAKPEHANIRDSFLVHALALCFHLGIDVNSNGIASETEGEAHVLHMKSINGGEIIIRSGWNAPQEQRTVNILTEQLHVEIDFGNPGMLLLNGVLQPIETKSALEVQWLTFVRSLLDKKQTDLVVLQKIQELYSHLNFT